MLQRNEKKEDIEAQPLNSNVIIGDLFKYRTSFKKELHTE